MEEEKKVAGVADLLAAGQVEDGKLDSPASAGDAEPEEIAGDCYYYLEHPGELIDWLIEMRYPVGNIKFGSGAVAVYGAGLREIVIPRPSLVKVEMGQVSCERIPAAELAELLKSDEEEA